MQTIGLEDLDRLRRIATQDRELFFARHADFASYSDRLIAVALCQGAALHFVDGGNGVKDFDVWSFFAEHPARRVNARRRASKDFGPSKFGRHPSDDGWQGRRVDLLMRGVRCKPNADPIEVIRKYLSAPETASAAYLAQKAVVLLEPLALLGTVVWPKKAF